MELELAILSWRMEIISGLKLDLDLCRRLCQPADWKLS